MAIDAALVTELIADQFPKWAGLPVTPVSPQGWDNRTFRIGDDLSARLPSAAGYAPQVLKEARWLPHLAAYLPVRIPEPVALGHPTPSYPFAWSVSRWRDGVVLSRAEVLDRAGIAEDLAAFLVALRGVPAADGPPAGLHSAYRGGPLAHYADEAFQALNHLDQATSSRAGQLLRVALATRWDHDPVWFHGDVAADNVLVREGRLHGVLDFGCTGVGDPACDLVIAFTWLDVRQREVFRRAVALDEDTWRRGRGWALWKAAITLADTTAPPARHHEQRQTITAVLQDSTTD